MGFRRDSNPLRNPGGIIVIGYYRMLYRLLRITHVLCGCNYPEPRVKSFRVNEIRSHLRREISQQPLPRLDLFFRIGVILQ